MLAFNIECTKALFEFLDAKVDSILMILYMVDVGGYLIISWHMVGANVPKFKYTPKPRYPGPLEVINEPDEEALVRRFLSEF